MSNRSNNGKKFRWFLFILLALILLSAVFLVWLLGARGYAAKLLGSKPAVQAEPAEPAETVPEAFSLRTPPRLRVYDEELQWFDGARWHTFERIDRLRTLDPAVLAEAELPLLQPEDVSLSSFHNRAQGTVPKVRKSSGGGSGGGGGGGGSSGGGSSGGGSSGGSDGEDINPFG